MSAVPYSTYLRVETLAGGVLASPRALIRAARSRFAPETLGRKHRSARHMYYRALLDHQRHALETVNRYQLL